MKFWFDLDGVLSDWDTHYGNAARVLADRGFPTTHKDVMESAIEEEFFVTIPPSPHLNDIVSLILHIKARGHYVGLASSTGNWNGLHSATIKWKMDWLRKQRLDKLFDCHLFPILGTAKSVVADGTSLLIDDNLENCAMFQRYGGAAIHYTVDTHNASMQEICYFLDDLGDPYQFGGSSDPVGSASVGGVQGNSNGASKPSKASIGGIRLHSSH